MNEQSHTPEALKRFAFLFAGVFLVISAVAMYRGSGLWGIGAGVALAFLLAGMFSPMLLKHVYILWMKFAAVLGWINTRVILTLVFVLIFAPVGLILRLLRRDILHEKIDRSAASYWNKKETTPIERKRYEHMF